MLPTRKIIFAMAGVAMLTLPATAFAKQHRGYRDNRPAAWPPASGRYQEPHHGWFKPAPYAATPADYPKGYYGAPTAYYPTARSVAWNNGVNGVHRVCDADGDGCRRVPNGGATYMNQPYLPAVYPRHANNGGAPCNYLPAQMPAYYDAMPPASMNLIQQRDWLIARRQILMRQIAQLRAHHDSRGAARLVGMIQPINAHIQRINNQLGSAPTVGNSPYVPAIANIPYGSYGSGNSGHSANPYYVNAAYQGGNAPYNGYAVVQNVGNAVLPMLSYIH